MDFEEVKKGINLLGFLSDNQIVNSKSEARRLIENKGLKINNILIDDVHKNIGLENFENKVLKISLGKKRHYILKIN